MGQQTQRETTAFWPGDFGMTPAWHMGKREGVSVICKYKSDWKLYSKLIPCFSLRIKNLLCLFI